MYVRPSLKGACSIAYPTGSRTRCCCPRLPLLAGKSWIRLTVSHQCMHQGTQSPNRDQIQDRQYCRRRFGIPDIRCCHRRRQSLQKSAQTTTEHMNGCNTSRYHCELSVRESWPRIWSGLHLGARKGAAHTHKPMVAKRTVAESFMVRLNPQRWLFQGIGGACCVERVDESAPHSLYRNQALAPPK